MEKLERDYTIPLRRAFGKAAPYKRTNRAIGAVRAFLERHMKASDVRIGQHLNEFLWRRGARNPPPRVKVHAIRDAEGIVTVEFEGKTFKESVRPEQKQEEASGLQKLTSKLAGKDTPQVEKAAPKTLEKEKETVNKAAPAKTKEQKPGSA